MKNKTREKNWNEKKNLILLYGVVIEESYVGDC